MANRVLLGFHSGRNANGLWISRPGVNVLTAADKDLMFSTDLNCLQPIQMGTVSWGSLTTLNIAFPDFGFYPLAFVMPGAWPVTSIDYTSTSNLRVTRSSTATVSALKYCILNLER